MKHSWQITLLILGMFLASQLIGLFVIHTYASKNIQLPYGLALPEKESDKYSFYFSELVLGFAIAVLLFIALSKIKLEALLKVWFFFVMVLALGLFLYSLTYKFDKILIGEIPIIATIIALLLTYFKVYHKSFILHNFTELLIYPGIATVFVPILNIYTLIFLLILISAYDMWAVWKSGVMQKMAKYQIKKLNIFSGFFVPYLSKSARKKIKKLKKLPKSKLKNAKVKVNLAILGGGDVVFPIISSGVVLRFWGVGPALLTIFGAFCGLAFLLLFSKKKKFYPAMPFITTGIFVSLLINLILLKP